MSEYTRVKTDMSRASKAIKGLGLDKHGAVQKYATHRARMYMDPYLPMRSKVLARTAVERDSEIEYVQPYSRVHYFGKLMVDPITGKGAFFSKGYGFWSRPNVRKIPSNRDMKYNGAPQRGPFWDKRMIADKGKQFFRDIQNFASKFKKK